MIKSVNNYPVSQLFDIEAGVVFAIPRYQREYSWGKREWEDLFDDIYENDLGYFLGSIICINQATDALAIQKLEMVDGQQRLITLSLLFAALYKIMRKRKSDLDEDQQVELVNLKHRLVLKKSSNQIRVIPQIQNNNKRDYLGLLTKIGVIDGYAIPRNAGNRRIFRSFYYFRDRLETMIKNDGNRLKTIMEFLDKVIHVSLVKIEVGSHADAYILFESLNNRGMPLTPIDLIKNKMLAHFEQIDPGNVDHYYSRWNQLIDYLGDDYSTQERFFRHYYNAFRNELRTIYNVPVARRSNLIQIYEKLISYDAKEYLNKISKAARIYSVLLLQNQENDWRQLEKQLKNLDRIQGTPSYLLMLYLLTHRDRLGLKIDHLDKIIKMLVCFFVRRNLTDKPPTRDLTPFFMGIINDLNGKVGDDIAGIIRNRLIKVSASDKEFRDKLEGPIYEDNYDVTRFILCALAEQDMNKENWLDLWRLENKRFVWTIEHIFPQGENIPKSWVDMIADGDEEKAREIQQSHVHKLGNLTISGYNSMLGNKSFEEKRDRTDRQGRPIGYKNKLKLNEDLATADKWSVEQIERRTEKLAEEVIKLFRME